MKGSCPSVVRCLERRLESGLRGSTQSSWVELPCPCHPPWTRLLTRRDTLQPRAGHDWES